MRALFPPARVLVRAPSWLGDFVTCEPVLRALHERFAAASMSDRVTIAAPAPLLTLVAERFPGTHRSAVTRGADPDPRAWRGHDVALLLDGSARSAWCAFRAGIPVRIGWSGGLRAPLLTCAVRAPLERGATPLGLGLPGRGSRRLPRPFAAACAELASLGGLDVADRGPRIAADRGAVERVQARLTTRGIAADERFVMVNAGARLGSAKAGDPRVLARLACASGLPIVLACGPREEANARATLAELSGARALLLDDPPLDLVELTALIELSAECILADSGPVHIAQALAKPITVLFGPTDPRHSAEHVTRVRTLRIEVPCGPCHRESCSLAGEAEHACMRRL